MKIKRILSVEDTRQYEEGPDDKWYPIPGSGVVNQCARCGRDHEVHATVELENGTTIIVGTGCMTADENDVACRVRSVLATQRTLKKNEGLLARYQALDAQKKMIAADVNLMTLPPIVSSQFERTIGRKCTINGFTMGTTFIRAEMLTPGVREQLEGSWRYDQQRAKGLTLQMDSAHYMVDLLQGRIEKSKAKIGELIHAV